MRLLAVSNKSKKTISEKRILYFFLHQASKTTQQSHHLSDHAHIYEISCLCAATKYLLFIPRVNKRLKSK